MECGRAGWLAVMHEKSELRATWIEKNLCVSISICGIKNVRRGIHSHYTYVLKLDQVFPKSVYSKPSMPWDTWDYNQSHYVNWTFRLQRPPQFCYKRCFPPQFEMMHNWFSLHQAGCSSLWTNQSPPQENSNCGKKQILHLINKSHKILVGWCNLGFQSIFWECTGIIHNCMTIGFP